MESLRDRLAQGDPSAFAELYDACADRVHHALVVRLGSRADADDALQETFLRLMRMRAKLSGVENLVAYVFTVARNEATRLLETRRRQCTGVDFASADDLFVEPSGADNEEAWRERPVGRRGVGPAGSGTSRVGRAESVRRPDDPRNRASDRTAARHGRHALSPGPGNDAPHGQGAGMNDEVEHVLGRLTARGAPPELRGRVLDAVWAELRVAADAPVAVGARSPAGDGPEDAGRRAAAARPPRYGRHMLLVVAASLVAAVGLNLLVHRTLDRRMAALLGLRRCRNRRPNRLGGSLGDRSANGPMGLSTSDRGKAPADHRRRVRRPTPTAIRQFTLISRTIAMRRLKKFLKWTGIVLGAMIAVLLVLERLVRLEHRYTA